MIQADATGGEVGRILVVLEDAVRREREEPVHVSVLVLSAELEIVLAALLEEMRDIVPNEVIGRNLVAGIRQASDAQRRK